MSSDPSLPQMQFKQYLSTLNTSLTLNTMPFETQAHPMAIPRDPTSAEIAHFLSTRSGDQMMQLVQSIREPAAQAALTTSLLFVPPTTCTRNKPSEKSRKALNAFVGFRCYYILIPVFKPWPMKKLSNPMGIMWEADPNKSLWSLMTKAWSVIRDQIGKEKAPLDQFFRTICPYLNIPSPETYLEHCGWTLNVDDEGTPTLSRGLVSSPGTFAAGTTDMTLSVEDIIKYCQSMGYAQEYISNFDTRSPTFLAQSRCQFAGKNTSVQPQNSIASSTHEGRLAARNKRRAKRQAIRDTGILPVLHQEIINAHVTDEISATNQDNTMRSHREAIHFYDGLADLLASHMGPEQQDSHSTPTGPVPIDEPTIAGWTDWSAFRLGADENATLPSFDPTSL